MKQQSAYRSSQGFALIAVLWLVAAMSVLVGGIMLTVRAELKTAGLSRQTINSLLKSLEQQGIIGLSYGAIEVLDLPGLRRAAGA